MIIYLGFIVLRFRNRGLLSLIGIKITNLKLFDKSYSNLITENIDTILSRERGNHSRKSVKIKYQSQVTRFVQITVPV